MQKFESRENRHEVGWSKRRSIFGLRVSGKFFDGGVNKGEKGEWLGKCGREKEEPRTKKEEARTERGELGTRKEEPRTKILLVRQSDQMVENTPVRSTSGAPGENEDKSGRDIGNSGKVGRETGRWSARIFSLQLGTEGAEADQTSEAKEREKEGEFPSPSVLLREKGALGKRLSLFSGSKEQQSERSEKRISFLSRSNKASREVRGEGETRPRFVFPRAFVVWDPRVYAREALLWVRVLLCFFSLFILCSWDKVNRGIKALDKSVVSLCKSCVSILVHYTPRKLIKGFLIYFCSLFPNLRHRTAVLRLLNALPSGVTKRAVSVYLKKVPQKLMKIQILGRLRDSPVKKLVEGVTEILKLPKTVLEVVFMSLASVLEFICRALKFGGGRLARERQNQTKLALWKMKRQTSLPSEVERKL